MHLPVSISFFRFRGPELSLALLLQETIYLYVNFDKFTLQIRNDVRLALSCRACCPQPDD